MMYAALCHRRVLILAVVLTVAVSSAAWGATYNVSTVGQLNSALWNARYGDEVVVAAGTYNLTGVLNMSYQGVTLRGATGNRDDVILRGSGMNTYGVNEGICLNTNYLTVSDLTVKDIYWNAIHIRGENQASHLTISNVKTWNVGQRHIKGSGGGGSSAISDNVLIENCFMLQTEAREQGNSGDNYIGGIDAMGVRNWTIRDNVAQGIRGYDDTGNAAIFLWQGVQNVTIERNRIYECGKGIGLGNPADPNTAIFTYPYHADDITVRNNMVLRSTMGGGNAIILELCNTKDVQVLNNTFYSHNASYFRTISPYDENGGGATTGLDFQANIIRGDVWDHAVGDWSIARLTADGNIVDTTALVVVPAWFVDWTQANLHLAEASTAGAVTPVNIAEVLADVPEDFDLALRGNSPDIGADEIILIAGDATLDWRVELDDLSVLAFYWDTPTDMRWNNGDFDGDSAVTLADLSILAFNWNVGTAGAIPEPASALLLIAGTAGLIRRRR